MEATVDMPPMSVAEEAFREPRGRLKEDPNPDDTGVCTRTHPS